MENNILLTIWFLVASVILLLGWLIYLSIRISQFAKEKKETSEKLKKAGVEGLLKKNLEEINKSKENIKELYQIAENLGKVAIKSITKIGLVRYNPFKDTGGDQSFSIALLNAKKDGIVISSLHGRGGTRVYSKPVKSGDSEYNLTEEEKKAIKSAKS
jgi:hypothetical protein